MCVSCRINDSIFIGRVTPEVLEEVIERIEIGHVTRKLKLGSVIQIYWKLR